MVRPLSILGSVAFVAALAIFAFGEDDAAFGVVLLLVSVLIGALLAIRRPRARPRPRRHPLPSPNVPEYIA